jgi:hypothetical protein
MCSAPHSVLEIRVRMYACMLTLIPFSCVGAADFFFHTSLSPVTSLRRNLGLMSFVVNILRRRLDSISLVNSLLRLSVPDAYSAPLLATERPLHACACIPPFCARLPSSTPSSRQSLCDLFATGIARLMKMVLKTKQDR